MVTSADIDKAAEHLLALVITQTMEQHCSAIETAKANLCLQHRSAVIQALMEELVDVIGCTTAQAAAAVLNTIICPED
jgi:hypothetical protein